MVVHVLCKRCSFLYNFVCYSVFVCNWNSNNGKQNRYMYICILRKQKLTKTPRVIYIVCQMAIALLRPFNIQKDFQSEVFGSRMANMSTVMYFTNEPNVVCAQCWCWNGSSTQCKNKFIGKLFAGMSGWLTDGPTD